MGPMKVVMLTKFPQEGQEHARLAGLAMSDVIIPGSERNLMGLRLTDDDLIVEFPSFVGHAREHEIRDSLRRTLAICKSRPPWERITG
jgi:hypothetical protein